jgi:IS5 family transposase
LLEGLPSQERKSRAGRKTIDPMIMLKLLILKQLYNLSNEQVEYQAHDRASFRRFLGLSAEAEIPDATSIGEFEDKPRKAGMIEVMFDKFNEFPRKSGYKLKEG